MGNTSFIPLFYSLLCNLNLRRKIKR